MPPGRRLAAWIVTGPLGHLYGGVADWATLLARYAWARARGRDPESALQRPEADGRSQTVGLDAPRSTTNR
jgi:hypothetical protein